MPTFRPFGGGRQHKLVGVDREYCGSRQGGRSMATYPYPLSHHSENSFQQAHYTYHTYISACLTIARRFQSVLQGAAAKSATARSKIGTRTKQTDPVHTARGIKHVWRRLTPRTEAKSKVATDHPTGWGTTTIADQGVRVRARALGGFLWAAVS